MILSNIYFESKNDVVWLGVHEREEHIIKVFQIGIIKVSNILFLIKNSSFSYLFISIHPYLIKHQIMYSVSKTNFWTNKFNRFKKLNITWSDKLQFSVLPLNSHTEYHLIILPPFIRQFKLLFLPAKRHLWVSYHRIEHFNLYHIILSILETQRLAVIILLCVWVAPSIRVHKVSTVSYRLVVVKFIFIFLYCVSEHNSE